MFADISGNLRDTFPGRMLIDSHLEQFARHPEFASAHDFACSVDAGGYSSAIRWALSDYLYGDDFRDVIDMDVDDSSVIAMSEAISAALRMPDLETFGLRHVHHGRIELLRDPEVSNRRQPSSLPNGAFWTSPVLAGGDAWVRHGEYNRKRSLHRYDVQFDADAARVAMIDSIADWTELLAAHPREHEGTLFPDWPSIADEWDGVHVSVAGMASVYPSISLVPLTSPDGSGDAHSNSGPFVGVGDWTVTSTAWVRLPAEFDITKAD